MTVSPREQVLSLARSQGVIAARQIEALGIHTELLTRLVREGALERVSRGQYRLADRSVSEHHGLVLATAAVPNGVICLLSALAFHGIGTQMPNAVWIALGRRVWRPKLNYPPLRVARFSGAALTSGVEHHDIDGQVVAIYNLAKTLADCFKYRNKLGLDVALEALNDAWRTRQVSMADIEQYARVCRVAQVMQPYLEALVA
jgi:predicted transcriptional regulator of viral defense system